MYYRINTLAKLLKFPTRVLGKELLITAKGRELLYFQGNFYAFPSVNQAIIPYELAKDYAQRTLGKSVEPPKQLTDLKVPPNIGNSVVNRQIAVLLGHFNHGKTTLLDTLINVTNSEKKSDLVSEEAHAITQEVRTKAIKIDDNTEITLIDTPGQEIFYRMRSSGAEVATFGLLLISMTDGICQQTQESIGILEELNVPAIVCLNKIDLIKCSSEEERAEKIRTMVEDCTVYNALEDAIYVPISARERTNIDKLISKIKQMCNKLITGKQQNRKQTGRIDPDSFLSGQGYVLNIFHDKYSSRSLHVVLTSGEIAVGDFIVAGGWSGRIKYVISAGDETPCQDEERIFTKGTALKLVIDYSEESGQPRPSGMDIHIFSIRSKVQKLESEKKSKVKVKRKRDLLSKAEEEGLYYMTNNVMEHDFDTFRLTEEDLVALRMVFLIKHRQGFSRYNNEVIPHFEIQNEENDDSQESEKEGATDTERDQQEDEEEEYTPFELLQDKVVLKATSDIEVDTIRDIVDDEMERIYENPPMKINPKTFPMRVVYAGVGNVSLHDLEIAYAAKAKILCYNVSAEKTATNLIKKYNLDVISFDKIQDVIEYVLRKPA